MPTIQQLQEYLNTLLTPELFSDYAPNGLQVLGRQKISKIVTGVTASQSLIDAALAAKADVILVHHGYFWRDENPCVVGMKHARLSTLIKNDLNLLAYHLPLDAHDIYGNSVQLASLLHLIPENGFAFNQKQPLGRVGVLEDPMSGKAFSHWVAGKLIREPLHIPGAAAEIKTIAWCTGGAQDYILEAVRLGVDAYLTGEVSERTVYIARETGIHFFAAGHHATERYGVKALGEHLAEKFNIEHQFIDIDNPV